MALLLLVLAMFDATPRTFLHDLFARHNDADYTYRGKAAAVSAEGFNCGFHHQVGALPFVSEASMPLPEPPQSFSAVPLDFYYTSPATGHQLRPDGRGPPQLSASCQSRFFV